MSVPADFLNNFILSHVFKKISLKFFPSASSTDHKNNWSKGSLAVKRTKHLTIMRKNWNIFNHKPYQMLNAERKKVSYKSESFQISSQYFLCLVAW